MFAIPEQESKLSKENPTPYESFDSSIASYELSELHDPNQSENHHLLEDFDAIEVFQVPPVDRGGPAWRFLAGVWLIESMLWGKRPI